MTHHWMDNVHTTALSPRDYQVELLAAAREQNTIVCLGHKSSKEFIALKLIYEIAHDARRHVRQSPADDAPADDAPRKPVVLYLCADGHSAYNQVFHLTDLAVTNLNALSAMDIEWDAALADNQVLILSPDLCKSALICSYLDLSTDVSLLVIEDCHLSQFQADLREVLASYETTTIERRPRILGLAGPLHSAGCPPGHLAAELQHLERELHCRAESASDIVTVLRYCNAPVELLLQCAPPADTPPCAVTAFLRDLVHTRLAFLREHRFDPSEIYSDEFLEEMQNYPDPKAEPIELLHEFLAVLDELGPWCADRAALNLLQRIEKLKVKTPYERHFLLLCMVSTVFVQIRAHCECAFAAFADDLQRIERFSTAKVHRLLQVLRLFKPASQPAVSQPQPIVVKKDEKSDPPVNERTKPIVGQLDSLNFEKCRSDAESLQRQLSAVPEEENAGVKTITEGLKRMLTTTYTTTADKQPDAIVSRTPALRQRPKGPNAGGRAGFSRHNRSHWNGSNDPNALCGLLFCNSKVIAKTLHNLLSEFARHSEDLNFLSVQFTIDRQADPLTETKEAETEHRRQEEVLKRFRMHECNLLIGTAVLEEGIDLPKCNLVIRWNTPQTYRSYVQCKGKARAPNALHFVMVAGDETATSEPQASRMSLSADSHRMVCERSSTSKDGSVPETPQCCQLPVTLVDPSASQRLYAHRLEELTAYTRKMVQEMAKYMHIEQMLMRKCENSEPPSVEQQHADRFTALLAPYRPVADGAAAVSLGTAVALVNKYCAKLPSDTFTKLTPLWRCAHTTRNGHKMFQYTLRLPINSPIKQDIVGLPMPTRILARRIAALITCRILHRSGELDNALQPIGKESFRATEPDWENFELEQADEAIVCGNQEPRPGTTKRRQYYYKRIASVFCHCRPCVDTDCYLYLIRMTLECPIPEEQNTRGRRIYPPEEALQSFGILTRKPIPKISAFPIFTRSGEVRVALELIQTGVRFDAQRLQHINTFLSYTFTKVLRLQKYLMLFDADASDNSFFIVPTVRDASDGTVNVDWGFLEMIAGAHDRMPAPVPEKQRHAQRFDSERFRDAVVMPWYRNQDQPQYFYVAEICQQLTPESAFPGDNYRTFREYYQRKYGIRIQDQSQPLLDVDHTSARLNFLTPRYVNRKGVALPTSSEETKRAKRENLEQKQILVPELCTIHPFPASLWRAAVCLPCVLYRINALLLADEIRLRVAADLERAGCGLNERLIEEPEFEWPMLNFGWSLAEVLRKSRETKAAKQSAERGLGAAAEREETVPVKQSHGGVGNGETNGVKKAKRDVNGVADGGELEIGTWTNEMAKDIRVQEPLDSDDEFAGLEDNVQMCDSSQIRYGSPTSWPSPCDVVVPPTSAKPPSDNLNGTAASYFSDPDDSYCSDDEDFDSDTMSDTDAADFDEPSNYLNIEFKGDNVAEAIESEQDIRKRQLQLELLNNINACEKDYHSSKNIGSGFDAFQTFGSGDPHVPPAFAENIAQQQQHFDAAIEEFQRRIMETGMLVRHDEVLDARVAQRQTGEAVVAQVADVRELLAEMLPFVPDDVLQSPENRSMDLDRLYEIHRAYSENVPVEEFTIEGTGDLFDQFNYSPDDDPDMSVATPKRMQLPCSEYFSDRVVRRVRNTQGATHSQIASTSVESTTQSDGTEGPQPPFSFDAQPDLSAHPGPSPSIILQALTMSNANDGINLERLETIGDSFLKYAITTYLYCTYEDVHEGKLSHLRSKQVSNLNLYRLGRRKMFGECMIATKFEPHDNWLPPCYYVPKELEKALIAAGIPAYHWNLADLPNIKELSSEEICDLVKRKAQKLGLQLNDGDGGEDGSRGGEPITREDGNGDVASTAAAVDDPTSDHFTCFIPYNLVTQHSIPDKSVADCVEALIGAYLIECGQRGALLFMAWLGIRVLPCIGTAGTTTENGVNGGGSSSSTSSGTYGHWALPKSPLLSHVPQPLRMLDRLLDGYDAFERAIGYTFRDRSYLLQAMTHASYSANRLTDCYQRLEFLGDAVLDYLITRHLYEDPRQHSPGALTDLRSALVNNTIFASLAVRHGFHKYFRHLSPSLNEVIWRFVRIQHENGHSISEEFYLISEEECDEAEDVEVPKALGDVFESVAGAIFLDSNMSLDTVWRIYSNMMRPEIELFSNSVPKSPIRELLELEPETAKFSKPEKLADGRRVRVSVEVFGKGTFRGIGRNYRIAKCTAAKCALRQLKKQGLIRKH